VRRAKGGHVLLPEETTVAIVGGGPAGAIAGAYLARAGIDNVIFEREYFPRHHVGESLVAAINAVLHEIGVLEKIDRCGYVRKRGAAWVPKSGRGRFDLQVLPDPPVGGLDYTWHVDRAHFDQLLLEHAASLGSRVEQGCVVTEPWIEEGRVVGATVRRGDEARRVRARFVLDASGRGTFLGSRLRLKQKDPLFDQFAIYGHFQGVDRGEGPAADYIHILFLPTERGWVWRIPLRDGLTSVGVVTEREDFRRDGRDPAAYFERHAHSNPELARVLKGAQLVGKLRTEGDYSYSMARLTGPGFLLVGDAARFVDPIFSSGVSVAAYSAKFATEALLGVLSGAREESEALAAYEARLTAGIAIWYDFIKIYYKLQNLFTYYVRKPDYQQELVRLLQGRVYDPSEISILDRLREDIHTIESTPGHAMQSALTDIPM
jgi:FADH2 O2-dependent halogenase